MKTLTMRRKGEFTVQTRGENPCGTEPLQKVRYRLTCVCAPKLDSRGFLFDQMAVQEFFDSIEETDLSCEELVQEAVKGILVRVHEENSGCRLKKVRLQLAPAPYSASVSYSIRGDELQDLIEKIENDDEGPIEFVKNEDSELRTTSSAPASAKKAAKKEPPKKFGLWNVRRNRWELSLDGEIMVFDDVAVAANHRDDEFNPNVVEVREYVAGVPSLAEVKQAKAPVTETAKRWGIWNKSSGSWMHAKGWDRVFNTEQEAKWKIDEKIHASNGRNWIQCEPRPYTGSRDKDAQKAHASEEEEEEDDDSGEESGDWN